MNILWILSISLFLSNWEFASGAVTVTIKGNLSVVEFGTISLTCEAKCDNGTCAYEWSGYEIPPASKNKPLLTLSNVSRQYKDKVYKCVVKDTVGEGNDAKKIDVFYGPDTVTLSVGSKLNVTEGGTYGSTDISCTASSACNPPCNIVTWTRENKNTVITTKKRLFAAEEVIKRTHAGKYTCFVSNGKSASKTENVSIEVHYPPNVILTWSESANTLKCQADGVPKVYTFQPFKQYHDKVPLKNYTIQKSGNIATYSFTNPNYQMTGKYFCYVTNYVGDPQQDSCDVKIEDRPTIVKNSRSYNVSKGSKLDVSMELYSYPAVKESDIRVESSTSGHNTSFKAWSLRNKVVDVIFYGTPVTMPGQSLVFTLDEVIEEDFTNYTVVISNALGNASSTIAIFPEGPPDAPEFNKDATSPYSVSFILVTGFFNGGEQTLVVEHRLEGHSEWSNKTYKDVGVEKNKRVILDVLELNPETDYEFRAYAFNKYHRSNYTQIIKGKTDEEPNFAGAIAGGVAGGLAILLIISILVILILRRRRKNKEINGGPDRKRNKDLTLKMPTSPVYENNCLSAENMLADEESTTCPISPEPTSNIYENTNMKAGFTPYDNPRSNQSLYKNPRSKNQLYDVPQVPKGIKDNQQSQKHLYDIPRTKNKLYDLPKPIKEVNKTSQIHGYQKFLFDSDQAGQEPYDNPPSHATNTTGNLRDNVDTIPPYLDLNNPNPIEEAYVDVIRSGSLVQQSQERQGLKHQGTISDDDYLDMNEVNKVKESPYVNTKNSSKPSEQLDNGSNNAGKDYQNVEQFKKSKSPPAVAKKPNKKNETKVFKKAVSDAEDESKDYQNVNKYKKIAKEPSVESAELYMTMSTEVNRQSVTSMPGFYAPPPPTVLEEDYMNIQLGKSK